MGARAALNMISNETFATAQATNFNYFEISGVLHTTLEFDKLIAIFSHKAMSIIPHSAYVYINCELNQSVRKGVYTKHSCNYVLQCDKQPLGEICFMRNHKFEDTELEALEALLCCLIYPLKNAILYHRVLKIAKLQSTDTLLQFNERPLEVFGRRFSKGVNAFIEHNQRLAEKNPAAPSSKDQEDEDDNPWAAGFYR